MQTAQDMIDAAKQAAQRGDLVTAQAFKERAEAIKAGPEALKRLELMADASMEIPAFLHRERAANAEHVRIDKALTRAAKTMVLDDIDPVASKLADELHGGSYSQTAYDKARAFNRYLKGADPQKLGAIVSQAVLSPSQLLEAVREGWSASELKAVMQESQSSLGGFLTSETVREDILGRATTLSVVRSRATIDQPGAGGSIGFPVWQGSGDIYSTALRGMWESETQAGSAEIATLGKISPPIKLWRLKMSITRSLLEDSGPRLVQQITKRIGEAASVAEDAQELTGNGSDGPTGVLALQSPGVLSNKDVRVTNSGAVAALTADAVVACLYSLPMQYRSAPGFCVTCSAATVVTLRQMKDAGGRYIFSDTDHTLLGYPLVESESMPAIAANSYPILFGDFAGYYVADRLGLSVQLYQDSTFADLDQVVLYVRRRVGGTPGEAYRFAALKVST